MNDTNEVKDVVWVITDEHITCSFGGKTYMVARTDSQAIKLIDALKSNRFDEVPDLVSKAALIERYTEGTFKVEDGEVLIDGEAVHGLLATKIIEFHGQGLPYEPLVAFARNVRKNPSERAKSDLYAFLDANKHPITDDGCFIAYKKVRRDFKDIHTGTMDNSVGQVVSVPRAEVDDDPNRTCSRGLHLSNFDYCSNHYGSSNDIRIMAKCNPAAVVAIPTDYHSSKMRVAEYTVLSVIESPSDGLYRDTTKPKLCGDCNQEEWNLCECLTCECCDEAVDSCTCDDDCVDCSCKVG